MKVVEKEVILACSFLKVIFRGSKYSDFKQCWSKN